MRLSTQKLAPLFVVLVAALLALPVMSKLHQNPVSANVQQQTQSDVTPKPKQPKPKQSKPRSPKGEGPSNDFCANAIAVTSCPFDSATDTSAATDEAGEPQSTCTDQGHSVWYSYTAGANTANVTVSTCNSDFDTAIMVWQVNGAPCAFGSFAAVACNDDFCGDGLQSTVQFVANPGANYKIQIGGYDDGENGGETGNLAVHIDCQVFQCPPIVVNGVLGSGSPDRPGFSGVITPTRLFRDGVASTCLVPKLTCPGTSGSGSFAFDAYPFTNASSQSQCVTVAFDPNPAGTPCGANAHATVYLGNFNPGNVCQYYLADVGSSVTQSFSFTVPAGAAFFVVINANVAGTGVGCNYKYTVFGDICVSFDYCVQDDQNPRRFVLINSITGAYEAHDCSKGLTLSGHGGVVHYFCKIELFDQGPNPKHPDRYVDVLVNPCTRIGDATVMFAGNTIVHIHDTNITNNTCACPMQP